MTIIDFFNKEKKYKEPSILFDIHISDEEHQKAYNDRQLKYKASRNFWNIYDELTEEIGYQFRTKIKYPILNVFTGFSNFYKYRKVIWNDRWWDYHFMTELLYCKIQDMYNNWDNSTGLDSDVEKEILFKMLKKLDIIRDINSSDEDQEKAKNEFFELFQKNYFQFWD